MSNIQTLAQDWLEAKRAESAANAAYDPLPVGRYKAVITVSEGKPTKDMTGKGLNLKYQIIDGEHAGRIIYSGLNPDIQPVKLKLEVDASGCKWLAEDEPEIWRKIAPAFETKPGKIGVKVEAI